MGIFPPQYAFIEGSILKKGHAQSNVESPKPGPFLGWLRFGSKKGNLLARTPKFWLVWIWVHLWFCRRWRARARGDVENHLAHTNIMYIYIYIYIHRIYQYIHAFSGAIQIWFYIHRENPQSKKILTDPWNIPWILIRMFMKGILFMSGLLVFEVHSGKLT